MSATFGTSISYYQTPNNVGAAGPFASGVVLSAWVMRTEVVTSPSFLLFPATPTVGIIFIGATPTLVTATSSVSGNPLTANVWTHLGFQVNFGQWHLDPDSGLPVVDVPDSLYLFQNGSLVASDPSAYPTYQDTDPTSGYPGQTGFITAGSIQQFATFLDGWVASPGVIYNRKFSYLADWPLLHKNKAAGYAAQSGQTLSLSGSASDGSAAPLPVGAFGG